MIKYASILTILCFFLANGQDHPPIEIYQPEAYGAETQNWAITQSEDKLIFVANNQGLLEFNGEDWTLYNSPNETIIRSIKAIDNIVYSGSYRDFGYWERNIYGTLKYTSLSNKLNVSFLDDEEIWNIIAIDDWILFQTFNRIYIYDKNDASYSIIESKTMLYKIFKVNGNIYFQKVNDGVYKIENGKEKLVSNHNIIQNNLLVNVFNVNNNLIFETETKGFYILENDSLKEWNTSANSRLKEISVYTSIQLKDGSFALGTISDGIIHLTQNGDINYEINYTNGLSNNTVLSVFEDSENNIWLGLDNGINCLNVNSPYSVYYDRNGKLGTVYKSIIFNDNLYLGTNQGLFYKPLNKQNDFTFIKETQGQVWNLIEIDSSLFCGHNSGTFIIENDTAKLISDEKGTWNIKKIPDSELLLQGNYGGLNILENKGAGWQIKNKIVGFDISCRFFEINDKNEILVSHENKGVFNVKVDKLYSKALKVTKRNEIENFANAGLIKYNDNIFFANKKGVFKYDTSKKQFLRDSLFSKLYNEDAYVSGNLIVDKKTNTLWSFSENSLKYISQSTLTNKSKINQVLIPEAQQKAQISHENIYHLTKQKYLIGTTNGYSILDLSKIKNKLYDVVINSITTDSGKDKFPSKKLINKLKFGDFNKNMSEIIFSYSVPEFDEYIDTKYQYQLIGIDDKWSNWSANSKAEFKYLPHGDYTFNLRAKTGNTLSSNIATYSFSIEKPWFLTNTAIALYVLSFLLFSLIMHNIYKHYYRKQREQLLQKASKEIELKDLENKQQLMKFNNDKLRQDIDSKNRELGISTMSLIKKNDFLNTIKKELEKVNTDSKLAHIIKIVDKNINNNDDWNLFEEAFNNADKDFLKKIKSMHPELTSNDLRLCAYLRLNLSSKEIAPLLNISSRSVEVKRYRLRKKLQLPHEHSLSNYILEI